jgi:UTP--glucose-1-phosphate uridylyltransferase
VTIKRVRKAVFPVAGLGTRFLPATKAQPKEMLSVVDRPLIDYAVEEAKSAGIEEFVFTRQQQALGLGHAVWCARYLVGDEPFAVILPDDLMQCDTPCLKQMVDAYHKVGGNLLCVEDVPREFTSRYGILDVEQERGNMVQARGIVEKPKPDKAPSTMGVIGRYILDPGIFKVLESVTRGAGGEIQLTDGLAAMIGQVPFHGIRVEGKRFDCGDKAGFIAANVAFALERDDLRDDVLEQLKPILSKH